MLDSSAPASAAGTEHAAHTPLSNGTAPKPRAGRASRRQPPQRRADGEASCETAIERLEAQADIVEQLSGDLCPSCYAEPRELNP